MVVLTEKKITPSENQVTHYSLEEYLALEEKAETKHEYHNGEIIELLKVMIEGKNSVIIARWSLSKVILP